MRAGCDGVRDLLTINQDVGDLNNGLELDGLVLEADNVVLK